MSKILKIVLFQFFFVNFCFAAEEKIDFFDLLPDEILVLVMGHKLRQIINGADSFRHLLKKVQLCCLVSSRFNIANFTKKRTDFPKFL